MLKGDVLIVDDNPNNLAVLASILQASGYQVRVANSGRRALKLVDLEPPELVMLDVQMPEMNGYEVCAGLKNNERVKHIPVIFISALEDVADKVRAFEAGGADYVTKPFQAEEVIARVENQLRSSRLQRELEQKQEQLERQTAELERQNAELARKNGELLAAQRRTNLVFSALSEALPGTTLDGKYLIETRVGAGGFGTVYRAKQVDLDRPVAVKVFRPLSGNDSSDALERFRREGVAACRFTHPNAVTIMDFGITASGIAFLVMELLEGETLAAVLAREGALPLARVVEIVTPVANALAAAHASGIIHRDIKPENIFLQQTTMGEMVKVLDFGIAKMLEDGGSTNVHEITETGNVLGTPHYVAPERVLGEGYDGRSDVYSLAVVTYLMLTGSLPFTASKSGGAYAVALQHLVKTPRPIRDIDGSFPEDVERVVMNALSKEPTDRPTATEYGRALAKALSG